MSMVEREVLSYMRILAWRLGGGVGMFVLRDGCLFAPRFLLQIN